MLPPGVTELACHPGLDDELQSTYRSERADEIRVLCGPRVREAIVSEEISIRAFGDITLGDTSLPTDQVYSWSTSSDGLTPRTSAILRMVEKWGWTLFVSMLTSVLWDRATALASCACVINLRRLAALVRLRNRRRWDELLCCLCCQPESDRALNA